MRSIAMVAVPLLFLSAALSGCNDAPPAKVNCADLISNADGTNPSHTKVEVETNKGTFRIELFDDAAPITAGNFKTYAQEGFFDHVLIHRIVKGFMGQGGKFDNTTKLAKTPTHGEITNEARTSGCANQQYTLSMARTPDPDSAQTEFFLNFKYNDFLDADPGDPSDNGAGYSVFGIVYDGRPVLTTIENVPVHITTANDRTCQQEPGGNRVPNCPNSPVEMLSVRVI